MYAARTGWFENGLSGYFGIIARQSVRFFNGTDFLDCLAPRTEAFLASFLRRTLAGVLNGTVGVIFLGLTVHGFCKLKFPARVGLLAVFLVYLAQIMFWPPMLGARVFLPFFPLMALCVATSLINLPRLKALHLSVAVFLGLTFLINIASSYAETRPDEARWREIEKTAAWMKANLPEDRRIWASPELPLFHFYHLSGRKFYLNPYSTPSQAKVISDSDYVLAWGRDYQKIAPIENGHLEELFQSSPREFQVMRVVHANR
jgi:hypothetical protein